MKILMCGLTVAFGVSSNVMAAEKMLNVDGLEYPLSVLVENCQSMTDRPAAQITCFSALSKLIDGQSGDVQEDAVSVPEALDALRTIAQYQDDDSGLSISGADCNLHVLYFSNYFHLSRRNLSTIDVFSAQFDASKLQISQTVKVQDGQSPLSKGVMDLGAIAAMRGGVALESARHNFPPKSPSSAIDAYANEVVSHLAATEDQAFNFVLIHPKRSQASTDIWTAFEVFVKACRQ